MTSSKKAKKPSSSFKKAWDQVAGQGDTSFNNDPHATAQEKGGKAVLNYRGLKLDQEKGEKQAEKKGSQAQVSAASGPATNPADPKKMVKTPKQKTVTGATAQQRGVSGTQDKQATTGAQAVQSKAGAGQVGADAVAQRKAQERQKAIDDAVAEGRRTAAQNKTAFGPEEIAKITQEAGAKFDADEEAKYNPKMTDEQHRNKVRDEKFKENLEWAASKGWDANEARKWALDDANKYADEKLKNGFKDDDEKEMAHFKEVRDKRAEVLEAQFLEKGMDEKEAKTAAIRQADEEARNQIEKERKKAEKEKIKNDPANVQKRQEALQQNLNWLGDTFKAMGSAGEYANKGLDLLGGVLHAALNPSPLGLNEAQSILSTTADAFNLANDLVKNIDKSVEGHVGKKIVTQMAKDMGELVNQYFGGKDISKMKPDELMVFQEALAQKWQPFMDRLDRIGGNNPVGAQIAKQFKETFGNIKTAATGNKKEATLEKRELENTYRHEKRVREEIRQKTQDDIVAEIRAQHQKISDPTSSDYDPTKALMWDLMDQIYGKTSYAKDANGNPLPSSYGWAIDPKMVIQDPATGNIYPTPSAAGQILSRIEAIKTSAPDVYNAKKAMFDTLERQMSDAKVKADSLKQEATGSSKYDYYNLPEDVAPAERYRRKKMQTDKDFDKGLVGGKISLNRRDLEELNDTCTTSCNYYYNLIKDRKKANNPPPNPSKSEPWLTQEELNRYTAAKNTQDLVTTIQRYQSMKKMYHDKNFTVRGEPILDENGNQKFDRLGRPEFTRVPLSPSLQGTLDGIIDDAIKDAIENTDMYDSDYAGRDAKRTRRMTYLYKDVVDPKTGKTERKFIATDPLFESGLRVQRMLTEPKFYTDPSTGKKRSVPLTDFPDMLGNGTSAYARQVGAMDYIAALQDIRQGQNINTQTFINYTTRVGELTGKIADSIGALDPNDKSYGKAAARVIPNALQTLNDSINATGELLQTTLPTEIANSIERKRFVEKATQEFTNAINSVKNSISNLNLSPDVKQQLTDICDHLKDISENVENVPDLKGEISKVASSINNLGSTMTNDAAGIVSEMRDQGDQTRAAIGAAGPTQTTVAPKAAPRRPMPNDIALRDNGTGLFNAWIASQPRIEDWPAGKAYWDQYDKLLATLENTPPGDETKSALEEEARKAFIRGMLGEIVPPTSGTGTFTIKTPDQGGTGGGKLATMLQKASVKNGKIYIPNAKGTMEPLKIPSPDGKTEVELSADDFQKILGTLYNMQIGGRNVSSAMWMIDKGAQATTPEAAKRVMRLILNIGQRYN